MSAPAGIPALVDAIRRRATSRRSTFTRRRRRARNRPERRRRSVRLKRKGYLRSREERVGKRARRIYTATRLGRRALEHGKVKVRELFGELFEDE